MREGFFLLSKTQMSYFGPETNLPTLYDEKQDYTQTMMRKSEMKRKKGICYGHI